MSCPTNLCITHVFDRVKEPRIKLTWDKAHVSAMKKMGQTKLQTWASLAEDGHSEAHLSRTRLHGHIEN